MSRRQVAVVASLAAFASLLLAGDARSQATDASASTTAAAKPKRSVARPADADDAANSGEPFTRVPIERGMYTRLLFTLAGGRGFRFNNPYRLRSQLGATEQSVSLTAPYVDLAVSMTFGNPFGLQHGGSLRMSIASEGVPQQAIGVSYIMLYRQQAWLGYGRAGLSVLTTPDSNAGGEVALGAAYFLTAALGITAEAAGSLFYGAATYDSELTTYPILSLQAGLIVDIEVLP